MSPWRSIVELEDSMKTVLVRRDKLGSSDKKLIAIAYLSVSAGWRVEPGDRGIAKFTEFMEIPE